MGMEDRDWYREKKIDWERGGLRDRNQRKRRSLKYFFWIAVAVLVIAGIIVLARMVKA